MKTILLSFLLSFLFFNYSHACFTDNADNAWILLPTNSKIIKSYTNEIVNDGLAGIESNLILYVSQNDFDAWRDTCGFEFELEGDLLIFHWDSELFMGVATYNSDNGHLEIEALRYKENS